MHKWLDCVCECPSFPFENGVEHCIVLNSGFCVLDAFIELVHCWLCQCALVQTIYVPNVAGQGIGNHVKHGEAREEMPLKEHGMFTSNFWFLKGPVCR